MQAFAASAMAEAGSRRASACFRGRTGPHTGHPLRILVRPGGRHCDDFGTSVVPLLGFTVPRGWGTLAGSGLSTNAWV